MLDANFKLDDLLKLELHKFADEVGEIVDCAQKEEKMEQGLAKLKVTLPPVSAQCTANLRLHLPTSMLTSAVSNTISAIQLVSCQADTLRVSTQIPEDISCCLLIMRCMICSIVQHVADDSESNAGHLEPCGVQVHTAQGNRCPPGEDG